MHACTVYILAMREVPRQRGWIPSRYAEKHDQQELTSGSESELSQPALLESGIATRPSTPARPAHESQARRVKHLGPCVVPSLASATAPTPPSNRLTSSIPQDLSPALAPLRAHAHLTCRRVTPPLYCLCGGTHASEPLDALTARASRHGHHESAVQAQHGRKDQPKDGSPGHRLCLCTPDGRGGGEGANQA
jgi:hypothetical protein